MFRQFHLSHGNRLQFQSALRVVDFLQGWWSLRKSVREVMVSRRGTGTSRSSHSESSDSLPQTPHSIPNVLSLTGSWAKLRDPRDYEIQPLFPQRDRYAMQDESSCRKADCQRPKSGRLYFLSENSQSGSLSNLLKLSEENEPSDQVGGNHVGFPEEVTQDPSHLRKRILQTSQL